MALPADLLTVDVDASTFEAPVHVVWPCADVTVRNPDRQHFTADRRPKAPMDEANAKRVAARVTAESGKLVEAYLCPCGAWHIGRRFMPASFCPPRVRATLALELGERVVFHMLRESYGPPEARIKAIVERGSVSASGRAARRVRRRVRRALYKSSRRPLSATTGS